MRSGIILFALVAAAAAMTVPKAADQDLLKKQQDIIDLLDQISQELPNQELYNLGYNYDILSNVQHYNEPNIVLYYGGMVKAGLVQPQGTVYSNSLSQLRKEVALLSRILLGAKNYPTFVKTAAWARVYVNEGQFVKALISSVLQREDTQGVILPPLYEIFPQYYIDARVIKEARDISAKGLHGLGHNVVIPANHTDHQPMGQHRLSYFTNDIGLNAYHAYISLAGYMVPQLNQQGHQHGHGVQYEQGKHHIGHGSQYYYLHQQLLARYNLERLGNGLGPIEPVDFENVKAPYHPHLQHINGLQLPGRPNGLHLTSTLRRNLMKNVHALEQRLLEAIDTGYVITPEQQFLSLYQPQGLNILGDLIEGTGRSVNPRYYGSLQAVARQLLGNTPEFDNIYGYTPSALELAETSVRDPAFYQLYKRVINLFLRYQQSLPAYQYDDLVLPGVKIEQIIVPDLVTYFDNFHVDLGNGIVRPINAQQQLEVTHKIKAQVQRLNHKQYQYQINVHSEQAQDNVVVRVYLGPKYNYDGQTIDINRHRHHFVELDQFVHQLQQGKNVIVRNSHQALSQSGDYPSVHQIKVQVDSAIRSQNPYYITEPQQIFGFPARLSIPKGTHGGYPLQIVVVITSTEQQTVPYGPVIPAEYQTYQQHQYQIVNGEQYEQHMQQGEQLQHHQGGHRTVEVIPDYQGNGIYGNEIHKHLSYYGHYLYKKHPSLYAHAHQTHHGHGIGQMGGHGQGHLHEQQGVLGLLGQQGQYMHQEQLGQGQLPQMQLHHGQMHQGQIHQGQMYQGQLPLEQGQQQQGQIHQGQLYPQVQQGILEGTVPQTVVGGIHHGNRVHGGIIGGGIHHGGIHGIVGGQHNIQGGQKVIYGEQENLAAVDNYYKGKHIGQIIGGAISLDGKPLGYPLDRPLAPSALYVPNIKVADVMVYHDDTIAQTLH